MTAEHFMCAMGLHWWGEWRAVVGVEQRHCLRGCGRFEIQRVCAYRNCRDRDLVPGAPVPVCQRHLLQLHEFARDRIGLDGD